MILGQIMGIAAILVSSVIYVQPKRKLVIFLKLITDFLWIAHHLLICSYTAAATTSAAVFRELIFMQNKKWARNKAWLYIFSAVFILSAFLARKDIFSVFPAVSSILSTVAFFSTDIKKIRIFGFASSLGMLVYGIHYFSVPTIINEIMVETSIITILIKNRRAENR